MLSFSRLAQESVTNEFIVVLNTEGSDLPELPEFIMTRPDPKTYARIQQRHEKILLGLGEDREGGEYRFNHVGFACDMVKFVTGLRGTDEPLDRNVLREVFERHDRIAVAFANGIRTILKTLSEQDLRKAEIAEKN